ncbi:MAG: hypothetical protein OXH52_02765 [Gammaproteobacteria bacterium]|nr:hypothetical protein [Gammaproteobacteria bacterium]
MPSTTIREAAWATADGPPTIHPRSFFGIAYFSVLFNVTGQVAVVGIPDITQLFFRCGTTKSG